MIEYLPELVKAGIDSFKIEGRMKTALYAATVARTYRKAIDDYFVSEETYRENLEWYRAEIAKCTYRQYCTGFYFGKPDERTQIYGSSTYVSEYVYLGFAEEVGKAGEVWTSCENGEETDGNGMLIRIRQKNKFAVGESVEIMKPDGRNVSVKAEAMYDEEGTPVESCPHAGQIIWVRLSETPERYDILRKKA